MTEDTQLLAAYAKTKSESAFTEIVSRHITLVYSTALRLLAGNKTQAEDVVQLVFTDLARKAHRIPRATVLSGWLNRHASYTSLKLLRTEHRRFVREHEAWRMTESPDENDWKRIAPILDETLQKLAAIDRDALLLRFFEEQDFRSIGKAIGASEEAARKRVSRALEEVRQLLLRRGVTVQAAALGTCLCTNALAVVPSGLIPSTATLAIAAAAQSAPSVFSFFSFMTMTKSKIAVVSALAVAGVGTPFLFQQQTLAKLRQENAILRNQPIIAPAAPQANNGDAQPGLAQDQLLELMRLRNEVGLLRGLSNQWQNMPKARVAATPGQASSPILAEQWADVGTSTPQAAAQTLLFALKSGNVNRVSEVLTWKVVGEQDHRLQEIQQHHVGFMQQFAGKLKDFAVQPGETGGKGNLTMRFKGTGMSGEKVQGEIPVIRRGNEWLIAGEIENLGSTPKGVKVRVSVPFIGPNRGDEERASR